MSLCGGVGGGGVNNKKMKMSKQSLNMAGFVREMGGSHAGVSMRIPARARTGNTPF